MFLSRVTEFLMESEGKDVIPNKPGAQDSEKLIGRISSGDLREGGTPVLVREGLTKGPCVKHTLPGDTPLCTLSRPVETFTCSTTVSMDIHFPKRAFLKLKVLYHF